MRIISKFSDYYDSILKHGSDERIVYFRNTETIEKLIKDIDVYLTDRYCTLNNKTYNYEFMIIGFCGKFIPVLKIWRSGHTETFKDIYIYSSDELKQFFNDNKIKIVKSNRRDYNSFWRIQFSRSFFDFYEKINEDYFIDNVFNKLEDIFNKHFFEIFYEYKVPIFVIKKSDSNYRDHKGYIYEIDLNPKLTDYHFYKVHDPYQTYQEIEMYLSGVLGGCGNNMVEISNKDMVKKKGFDNMSFKTNSPGKKRKRRNKNG